MKKELLLDAVLALSAALVRGRGSKKSRSTPDAAAPEETSGAWGGGFDAKHSGSFSHPQQNRVAPRSASPDDDSRVDGDTTLLA